MKVIKMGTYQNVINENIDKALFYIGGSAAGTAVGTNLIILNVEPYPMIILKAAGVALTTGIFLIAGKSFGVWMKSLFKKAKKETVAKDSEKKIA